MRAFQLPVPRPTFDPENERQNRNALQQHLQELSRVNEGALAFTDLTLADASATKHGLLPKLSNVASQYLDGTGHWSIPGAGTGVITPVDWSFHSTPTPTALSRVGWTLSAYATGTDGLANAIDGSESTRWASGTAVTPNTSYFKIDLGSPQSVGALRYSTDAVNILPTGDIQWSDDNVAWTTAASWVSGDWSGSVLTKSWTPVPHRYWQQVPTSTPSISTNWWSIYEINLYASPYVLPTWHASNQTWEAGGLKAVWLKGVLAKTLAADACGVGMGVDTANMYALFYDGNATNLLLVKVVAGTQSTLVTIPFDSDTAPHEFEMEVVTPVGPGQANWITVRGSRANNPQTSASIQDASVDFTAVVTGTFPLLATTDMIAQGCFSVVTPATSALDALCTSATGGTYVYQDGPYKVHAFTASGTLTITKGGIGLADVFVVGAGGGANEQNGGGAGAVVTETHQLAPGSYSVTIGAPGTGGAGLGGATAGGASSFDSISAPGGSGAGPNLGGASGAFSGGTWVGLSGSCASPPCAAGFSAGGGGASGLAAGGNANITGQTFDCVNGICIATGTWGAGGTGTHLDVANHDSVTYTGFDVGYGGYGAGSTTGSGAVSGPSVGTLGGELFGYGGAGASSGPGGNGGPGLVLVRYLYDPTVCDV